MRKQFPHHAKSLVSRVWSSGKSSANNQNPVFPGMGIPMLKIRWSRDRLIFNMGIPILVRQHLYIETSHGLSNISIRGYDYTTNPMYPVPSLMHRIMSLQSNRKINRVVDWRPPKRKWKKGVVCGMVWRLFDIQHDTTVRLVHNRSAPR